MQIVILDTEYTTWPGALENGWSEPGQHREIVQMAAVLVDGDFAEMSTFERIVRPTCNPALSPLFVELTGIGQEQVDAEGVTFATALHDFERYVDGRPVICMNGDCRVILDNCDLNGVPYPFSRQFHRLRPLLERSGVDLTRRSSGDLHELTPTPLRGHTHNALHDVRSMAAWLAHAKRTGDYRDLEQLPTSLPVRDPRSSAIQPDALDAATRVLRAAGVARGWFERSDSLDLHVVARAMISAASQPED